jgi:hypothetical protein
MAGWAPDYITLTEAKEYLHGGDAADAVDDTRLAVWITTASRAVDDYCGRQFGQVDQPQPRTYTGQDLGAAGWRFEIDDLQDVADLAVADAAGDPVTAYAFGPVNAVAKARPYEWLTARSGGDLTVTGRWGWSQVPAAAKSATLLQVARLAVRRNSPDGIAGSPSEGGETRLLAQLDPDLRTSLKPLSRRRCVLA